MKVSILLPVYNESATIETIVEKIYSINWPIEFEVIIVDDGSTDGTPDKLSALKGRFPAIVLIEHRRNLGKGGAIKTAIKYSSGDIIAIQDADLEYEPSEIKKLIRPILEGQADVVYGSRFLNKKKPLSFNLLANRFLTFLVNLSVGLSLTDMETCQKVFKRKLVENMNIRSDRFGIEPELTIKFARRGARFIELPIQYNPRTYKEGKKITWWDGIKAIFAIIYFRFFDSF